MHMASSRGLESVLETVGRTLSERFGIRVVCQGDRCCTDGKTIFLPGIPDDVPNDLMQVIRGFLDHEASHLIAKSDFAVAKDFRSRLGSDAFYFLNCLEDLRVEQVMRDKFPGSGFNLEQAYRFAISEAARGPAPLQPLRQLAFAIHSRIVGAEDLPFVDKSVYALTDEIWDIVKSAPACRNTREVATLAEAAWNIVLQRLQAQQQHQPSDPGTNSNQLSQGPQNQSNAGPDGPTPNPGSGGASNQGGENAGSQQPNSGEANSNQSTATGNTQHTGGSNAQSQAGGENDAGIISSLGQTIAGLVSTHARQNGSYRAWSTNYDKVVTAEGKSQRTHQDRMYSIQPHVGGVRQRLLQALMAEPKARWRGDRDQGNINPRALHRLAVPSPRENDCVFRQRVKTDKPQTAVTLLIDQSNSMRGSRIKLAAETALVFCEALSRLNISCSVVGFSTGSQDVFRIAHRQTGLSQEELQRRYRVVPLRHTYYKRFHEKLADVSGRFDNMHPESLTPLGESILFAARELAARREERKVLFVLTDGKPVVGFDPEDITYEHAKTSIKRAEAGGVDVMLIGIMESCVTDLHHRAVVVNSLTELPRTVISRLQSMLMNPARSR